MHLQMFGRLRLQLVYSIADQPLERQWKPETGFKFVNLGGQTRRDGNIYRHPLLKRYYLELKKMISEIFINIAW